MDSENEGISLLRRGQKGLMAAVFSRMGIILLLFVLQIFVIFAAFLSPALSAATCRFISSLPAFSLSESAASSPN